MKKIAITYRSSLTSESLYLLKQGSFACGKGDKAKRIGFMARPEV